MIDEHKFIEYVRKQGIKLLEESGNAVVEEVSIDGVIERFKDDN